MSEKLLFVDLSGTLIHHETQRPVALMPELLASATRQGWTVMAISRYPLESIREMLRQLGLAESVEPLSSSGTTKGEVIDRVLARREYEAAVFVDDKPENLESAKRLGQAGLRILGFVGSRKYVPRVSEWCYEHRTELALSAIDLAETLGIPLPLDTEADRWLGTYSANELADLLLGSDHPASATAGSSHIASHRAVPFLVLEGNRDLDYERFWKNLAWVGCRECSWKLLVRSVVRSMGLEESVLGDAYKEYEYVSALAKFLNENPETEILDQLRRATDTMEAGVGEFGRIASVCRPKGRMFDQDRIADMKSYLNQVEEESRPHRS